MTSVRAARISPACTTPRLPKPEDIVDPRIELFRPKDGDPDDYVAIRCSNGERYALTNTCAANILGYAKPGWHAHGNAESARRAFAPLAQRIGSTIEEAARRVLDESGGQGHPASSKT